MRRKEKRATLTKEGALGYGKGNSFTLMLFERSFKLPKNVPLKISTDHLLSQQERGLPWDIWWENHLEHNKDAERFYYDKKSHAFGFMREVITPLPQTGSGFFCDDN